MFWWSYHSCRFFVISKGVKKWNRGFSGACRGGHIELAQFIISKAAQDNVKDKDDIDGGIKFSKKLDFLFEFTIACKEGNMDLVNFLISKGVASWNNGLVAACSGGHIDIVQFMISKGANNLNDAFYIANNRCFAEPDFILVAASEIITTITSFTPKRSKQDKYLQIMKLLISKGASIPSDSYAWGGRQPTKDKILKLLYAGIDIKVFNQVQGYKKLELVVANVRKSIMKSKVMLPVLRNLISKCIII